MRTKKLATSQTLLFICAFRYQSSKNAWNFNYIGSDYKI